jgi:hypothetical protein
VCNGDATSHESMQGSSLPAFNGLCQVIVRGRSGKPGKIIVTATADGLEAGKAEMTTR